MPAEGRRVPLALLLPMFLSVAVLVYLGISSIQAWFAEDNARHKQPVFLLFALAVLLAVQLINYRKLLRLSPLFYALSMLPVLYTVIGRHISVPLVSPVKGAYAWINFGSISFQPSELTKIALVLLLAWMFRDPQERRNSPKLMLQALALATLPMLLILQQPDLGTALTLLPPILAIVYLGGVRLAHLLPLALIAALLAPVMWFAGQPNVPGLRHMPQLVKGYQRLRVEAMFSEDPRVLQMAGYQQERALEALGSGGMQGKGRGNIPVGLNVPEAHTDMIVALIGEQHGLLGVGMLLLSYLLLFGSGLAIAAEQRDHAGKMLVVGLVTLLAGQTMLNLAVAFRIMPVTGVTLPLVSYGGSSLVATFLAIGLIVNVARNQKRLLL